MKRRERGARPVDRASLPEVGRSWSDIAAEMATAREHDADWRGGRTGSLVYWAGDEAHQVIKDAYLSFFSENGLGLKAFPSLKRFEEEVVAIAADLMRGETAVGSITSGGTESILMGVKTARDRARAERPQVKEPEILAPYTAHPAFNKAAHFLGMKVVRIPVRRDFRADVPAMAAAVNDNTVLMVGSAPGYPHGVIDPIPELAAIAARHEISFHVDACVGGFCLPFLRMLGQSMVDWDFAVPGVTSISADIHKYGFAAKGASLILHRTPELFQYQHFVFDGWPMATYSTANLCGTRPGGAIAAAWAILQFMGDAGYRKLMAEIKDTTLRLVDGINAIPGLEVWGEPEMSVFGYGSRQYDIFAIADLMEKRGWYINRQKEPAGIHLMIIPTHTAIVPQYLADLAECARRVASGERGRGSHEVSYN